MVLGEKKKCLVQFSYFNLLPLLAIGVVVIWVPFLLCDFKIKTTHMRTKICLIIINQNYNLGLLLYKIYLLEKAPPVRQSLLLYISHICSFKGFLMNSFSDPSLGGAKSDITRLKINTGIIESSQLCYAS